MDRFFARAVVMGAALVVMLAGCSNNEAPPELSELPEMQSVTGTVSYRERIMLSQGAMVNVQLLDVSRADMPATLLAEQTIEQPGQVPVAFELLYNPGIIDERMSYAVQARIFEGSELRFTTDTVFPVLTRGAGTSVDLTLVAAGKPPVPLSGTNWQLVRIRGEALALEEGRYPRIKIDQDSQSISGFTGCNNFSGNYSMENDKLTLGELAMTMMACPGDGEIEKRFMETLQQAQSFAIEDGSLVLATASGPLLIFEAAPEE